MDKARYQRGGEAGSTGTRDRTRWSGPTVRVAEQRIIDADRLRLPGYRVSCALPQSPAAPRLLAVRGSTGEQVVLHPMTHSLRRGLGSFQAGRSSRDARRFFERLEPLRREQIPHTLPIIDALADASGWHWVATPYTGSADGLTSLEDLRRLIDAGQRVDQHGTTSDGSHAGIPSGIGSLGVQQTEHAVRHLLTASRHAHEQRLAHGPIDPSSVLIDKRGALAIELYGVRRLLSAEDTAPIDAIIAAELRSIARIAYTSITGTLDVPEPYIDASRLDHRVTPEWDCWLDYALDPSRGFEAAAEALDHLPPSGFPLPTAATRSSFERTRPAGPSVFTRRAALAGLVPWRARHDRR